MTASPLDIPINVTFFSDEYAKTKTERITSLRDAVGMLTTTTAPRKTALPWLKLARFGEIKTGAGSLRHDENLLEIHGIEADYDGKLITLDQARATLEAAGISALLYTSPSHTPQAPRWRILCPTSAPLPAAARSGLVARLNGLFAGNLAGESFTLSQAYYYGMVAGSACHEVVLVDGEPIDRAAHLDIAAMGRKSSAAPLQVRPWQKKNAATGGGWGERRRSKPSEGTPYGRATLAGACADICRAADGEKHRAVYNAGFSVGGLIRDAHVQESAAWNALNDALAVILPRCKDTLAALKTLKDGFEKGKQKPRNVPERITADPADDPNTAPLLQKIALQVAKEKRGKAAEVPQGIFQVDGLVKELFDDCLSRAYRPQPLLSMAAAISAVAVAAGRRYVTTTGLCPNLYIVSVAPSGAGKDWPLDYVRRVLSAADMVPWLGGESIASGAGLVTALAGHPVRIFCLDELGMMLQSITGKKAATYQVEIMSNLMKFYSRANSIFYGKQYANEKEHPRVDIQTPHVAVFGATTPSTLWGALEGGALIDGSIARFNVFLSNQNSVPRNKNMVSGDFSASILCGLKAISAGAEGHDYGNMSTAGMLSTVPMAAYPVPYTHDAHAAMEAYLDKQEAWQARISGDHDVAALPGEGEIVARIGDHCAKFAMVAAIGRDPSAPLIEVRDVDWAASLTDFCAHTLLSQSSANVADSEYERKLNKAYDLIARFGPITEREMIRRGFKLPERERQEILNTLAAGDIIIA